ncbi:MAG: hypothetical protein IPI67_18470 [Myxococcales bacterium]|nr:hypothetical protein [Myxococcales bacterium]
MHAYDRMLARRCVVLGLVLSVLVSLVAIATDEAASTLGTRSARMAVLLPAIAVIAQQLVLAQCRARGELLSLAALGASPLSQTRGVLAAGLLIGALAIVGVAAPWSDVGALFPVVQGSQSFASVDGALRDLPSGASVSPDGRIAFVEAVVPEGGGPVRPGRGAAARLVAPLALAAPVWGVVPIGSFARGLAALLALALSVVLLHVVATLGVSAWSLVLAAAPLGLQTAWSLARRSA